MKSTRFLCFIFLTVFDFYAMTLNAQVILEEGFENSTCPDEPCEGIIDEDSCLAGWSTSHGTPQVSGYSAYEGDSSLYILFDTNPSQVYHYDSEGAYYEEDSLFVKGNCYVVRFWYKFRNVAGGSDEPRPNFKVDLANGLSYNLGNCLADPPSGINTQNIFTKNASLMYDENTSYTEAILTFEATDYFDQLWVYLDASGTPASVTEGFVLVDYLRIEEVDCDFPCSCPGTPTQIGSPGTTTKISSLNYTNEVMPSGCYEIAGTLVVDESHTASYSTFKMQPGSEIVISEDAQGQEATFTVGSSTFEGCFQMWKGIRIEPGSALIAGSVTLKDAQYAIYAESDATGIAGLSAINCTFDRNYIGIYTDTEGFPVHQPNNLDDNSFVCNGVLLPPYNDQSPDPGQTTLAGIYLNDTNGFHIGVSSDSNIVNTFSGIRNGIIADGSTFNAHYCEFTELAGSGDMTDFMTPFDDLSGIGVYLYRCIPKITNNYFSEAFRGVMAVESDATVNENDMDELSGINRIGILFSNCDERTLYAIDNELKAREGIAVENCHFPQKVELNLNTITLSPTSTQGGIRILDSYTSKNKRGDLEINDNTISTTIVMSYGISLQDSRIWQIQGNSISSTGSSTTGAGILLENTRNCQVRENDISGKLSIGIEAMNSPGILYCCNELDGTTTGMEVDLMCDNSRIKATQFEDHTTGLHYLDFGVTGDQGGFGNPSANNWTSATIDDDAIHEGGTGAAADSRFFTLSSQAPIDPDPSNWFTNTSGPNRNCINWSECGESTWLLPDITRLDSVIADRGFDTLEHGYVLQWIANKHLYQRLRENPDLVTNDQVMEDFKLEEDTTDIGALYGIEADMDTARIFSVVQDSVMNVYYQEITDYLEELDSLYALLVTASSTDSTQLLLQKDTILDSLQVVANTYILEQDSFKTDSDSLLQLVKTDNTALSVDSLPAVNEKDMNRLELAYHLNDYSLTGTELSDLYDIGEQCPLTGGSAVFRARGLHDIITRDIINWDSLGNCSSSYGQRQKAPEVLDKPALNIFPNPAQDQLTVQIQDTEAVPKMLTIYDGNGRLVAAQEMPYRSIRIDTGKLPIGIYSLSILLENGRQLSERVVIIR